MYKDNKVYTCIASCPELDRDGSTHCSFIGREINESERDLCPCGNVEILVEVEEVK